MTTLLRSSRTGLGFDSGCPPLDTLWPLGLPLWCPAPEGDPELIDLEEARGAAQGTLGLLSAIVPLSGLFPGSALTTTSCWPSIGSTAERPPVGYHSVRLSFPPPSQTTVHNPKLQEPKTTPGGASVPCLHTSSFPSSPVSRFTRFQVAQPGRRPKRAISDPSKPGRAKH